LPLRISEVLFLKVLRLAANIDILASTA